MTECKHQWQSVDINPYVPLPLGDAYGTKAEVVLVCIECNTFKTIDVKREEKQIEEKEFTYNTCDRCNQQLNKCNCE